MQIGVDHHMREEVDRGGIKWIEEIDTNKHLQIVSNRTVVICIESSQKMKLIILINTND